MRCDAEATFLKKLGFRELDRATRELARLKICSSRKVSRISRGFCAEHHRVLKEREDACSFLGCAGMVEFSICARRPGHLGLHNGIDVGVSKIRGPQNRLQYTMILVIRTPKGPRIFGNPHVVKMRGSTPKAPGPKAAQRPAAFCFVCVFAPNSFLLNLLPGCADKSRSWGVKFGMPTPTWGLFLLYHLAPCKKK